MTEKEKMLAGELYDPSDPTLTEDREKAKRICQEYNQLMPEAGARKEALLEELFQTKTRCTIEPTFFCDYGYNISFGKNFYMNHNCIILDVNTVTFGDNVMIGPNVQIYTATHPVIAHKRNAGRELGYPITIGDNVWIGGSAIIMPRVNIGDNVVIGAGSVVTKDFPDNVVIGGNPAEIIKTIDKEESKSSS